MKTLQDLQKKYAAEPPQDALSGVIANVLYGPEDAK